MTDQPDPWTAGGAAAYLDATVRDGGPLDLARTALALALLDHPVTDPAPYLAHLDALCTDLAGLAAADTGVAARAEALALVLARLHGYDGDRERYDDMQNADLVRVIDRRRGLPVALGILYAHAGRAQGWQVDGIDFPGHFLVRVEASDGRLIVDPFGGGAVLSPPDLRRMLKAMAGDGAELAPAHHRTLDDREVLLRLLNNIKLRALQAGEMDRGAEILRRMLLIAPDRPELWYERGAVEAQRGHMGDAIAALERSLGLNPDPRHVERVRAALERLRARLH